MGFGVREFELALMHRMRDLNPDRVEDALAAMDATRAELRQAHAHWTRLTAAAPRGARRFVTALGRPPSLSERPVGSLTCDALSWPLPSWPGLEFEVLTGPGGEVWNAWFVRPGAARVPDVAGLVPWEYVVADVAFPGATQDEGSAPHHWVVSFRYGTAAYRARFVYGLFQRLDPVTG
ncbi:hypothetical protein [Nonomuraea typhae]|uniref:hypothetical protein n=1 Tax=Nonomuraea typhae TaxID=2603600 RepID=UPI001CA549B6|nr:hypothetical protein [Nonomuraea typhae]